MARIPPDAFDFYFSLGPSRSYQAVANHFGVTKRAVTKLAVRQGWQQRLADLESKARERSDSKIVDTIESMNGRHLKIVQVIQGRALEALKQLSLPDAMSAVRALDMSIKQERTIRGEPGERSEMSLETVVRREYERWMKPSEGTASAIPDDDERSGDALASG